MAFAEMSVAQLKALLNTHEVDMAGSVEKEDLVALCREHISGKLETSVQVHEPGTHHTIEQNTPEWFAIRRGAFGVGFGASEAAAATGQDGYAFPYSLYEKLIAQQDGTWENDPEQPEACVHGHTCEPLIAGMYKFQTGAEVVDGGFYQHPDEDFRHLFGASPDRLVLSRGLEGEPPEGDVMRLVEIKAPFGQMYKTIKKEHLVQVMYQMWCSGVKVCDYVAVKLDRTTPEKTIPSKTQVYFARIHYSEEYVAWMVERLFFFAKCVILRQPPPKDLYKNETMGFAPPPKPRIEEFVVETGAWRITDPA